MRKWALSALSVFGALAAPHSVGAQILFPSTAEPDAAQAGQDSGTLTANRPSQADAPVGPVTNQMAPSSSKPPPTGSERQLGIFTLAPGGTLGGFFDDNVYATNAFRRSDFATFARPELSAVAAGADYGIRASAFLEGRKYARLFSEDQVNGGASIAAVYQPDASTQVRAQANYLYAHEDRGLGASAYIVLDRPVAFNQVDGALALNKRFGDVWTSVGASALGLLYENSTLRGLPINQTYRNVAIPTITGRVGHVIAPLTSVFGEVTGNARDFQFQQLSSSGYRTVFGVLFEPGPGARVKGEAFAGYMHQDYLGAGLQTIDSWTYGGSIGFLLANDLTLTVDGHREPKETGLFGGSLIQNQLSPTGGASLIETSIGGRFDYQLLPRVLLEAGATYLHNSYNLIAQTDRYVSPSASVTYTLTQNASVGVQYRRLEYRADIAGLPSFFKDVFLLSVHATF